MRSNGGLIGAKKTASSSGASGIWSLAQAQQEQGSSTWTMVGFPVNYLVLAGGGGGGQYAAGGGGAGGLRSTVTATGGGGTLESALVVVTATNLTVTVGAGGNGYPGAGQPSANGYSGSNSVFSTITSTGGGGGGGTGLVGVTGGSSGGCGAYTTSSPPGNAVSGQGYVGGVSSTGPSAGGGGGAGGVGQPNSGSPSNIGGNGGIGVASSITGSSVTYGGGGGGGGQLGAGIGGSSIGGNGATSDNATSASPANRGSGGGGQYGGSGNAGNGSSGVVILSYSSLYRITIGAGLTGSTVTSGSNKITTFTSGTGTVSFALAADYVRTSVAGYWMAGYSGGFLTSGEKFNFASQTNAATANALPAGAQQGQSGSSNSGVAGYLYGSTSRTIIQKILFSTDATSNLVAVLSANNRQSTGFSDYAVAGYCAGGYNDSTGGRLNTFERLAFPAETSSTLGVYLTAGVSNQPASFGNRGVAGYVAGGYTAAGSLSRVDKLTFPAQVKSTLTDTLTAANYSISGGFTNDQVAGYVAGGSGPTATVDKFALPTDVKSTTTSMPAAKSQIGAYADAGVAGYYVGGYTSSWTQNIVKNTFPSDTVSNLGNILVVAAREDTAASFSNEGEF